MESEFRRALAQWLRDDPVLSQMVNAIEEEGPVAASPPSIAIVASASAFWEWRSDGIFPFNLRFLRNRLVKFLMLIVPGFSEYLPLRMQRFKALS